MNESCKKRIGEEWWENNKYLKFRIGGKGNKGWSKEHARTAESS
jgi:hypothetical protein